LINLVYIKKNTHLVILLGKMRFQMETKTTKISVNVKQIYLGQSSG